MLGPFEPDLGKTSVGKWFMYITCIPNIFNPISYRSGVFVRSREERGIDTITL